MLDTNRHWILILLHAILRIWLDVGLSIDEGNWDPHHPSGNYEKMFVGKFAGEFQPYHSLLPSANWVKRNIRAPNALFGPSYGIGMARMTHNLKRALLLNSKRKVWNLLVNQSFEFLLGTTVPAPCITRISLPGWRNSWNLQNFIFARWENLAAGKKVMVSSDMEQCGVGGGEEGKIKQNVTNKNQTSSATNKCLSLDLIGIHQPQICFPFG